MSNSREKSKQAFDFTWAFGLNRFSLRLMGIWPSDKNVRSRSFYTVVRLPFMIIVMIFGLFLPQMYALALVIRQLPLVIDNLLTSSPTFTSCIKLFFIWRNSLVVDSATDDWHEGEKDPSKLEIMKSQASSARLVTIIDYAIMGCCYAGFVVSPFVSFDMRVINNITDYGERSLLVQSYYPYDYSASPRFEFTQCFQLMGSFFVGMAVSIPDDYFCALVLHVSAQFEILARDIEQFVRFEHHRLYPAVVEGQLRAFIDRHVHLNRMVSLIEQAFSYVIAAQIFCMSTMVCCLGFQILGMLDANTTEKPDSLQIVTLVGTLFTMMTHTLVDCFASETLASRSEQMYMRICNGKWYHLPSSKVRCLVPMMIASKTPRQIKAGKIFFLSMATYCNIIKSTAGYISMLIAVSSR